MEIRIADPKISAQSRILLDCALSQGRLSEGSFTRDLEATLAKILNATDVILTNSGHSALILAYRLMRDRYKAFNIVSSPISFISTLSAAFEAGFTSVFCVDTKDNFLLDEDQAEALVKESPSNTVYVPVHLFGYRAEKLDKVSKLRIQDACEAFGTKGLFDYSSQIDVRCYSFYTSHVLGCGELGCVAVNVGEDGEYIRSLKDQGREYLRPQDHVDKKTSVPKEKRYSHKHLGYNFRTTDFQAAILQGMLPDLERTISRRSENFLYLSNCLKEANPKIAWTTEYSSEVSYLAFPIICRDALTKQSLMHKLEEAGIETRPMMSILPEEEALRGLVKIPFGIKKAKSLHERSFYITLRETLTGSELQYMGQKLQENLR